MRQRPLDLRRRRKVNRYVDPENFYFVRRCGGLNREDAALLLGVTVRTIGNWETGQNRVPYTAFKLLKVLTGYELPGDDWEGWSLRGDTLYSPDGRSFKAWELMQLELVFSMARLWREVLYPKSRPTAKILPYFNKVSKEPQAVEMKRLRIKP